MYKCECNEKGEFNHSEFKLIPTEVDKEGCCVRCGSYAYWSNPEEEYAERGSRTKHKVTVFKVREGEYKQFTNTQEASKWAGYASEFTLGQKLAKNSLPCFSNTLGIVVVDGHTDEIPDMYKKYNKTKLVFAFCYETGKLLHEGSVSEISKIVKESTDVIYNNLARGSIKTKKGYVYSTNANFNLKGYKRAMAAPSDFDAPKWRQEVVSFEDDELGVSAEVDHYGTWKEKLYS